MRQGEVRERIVTKEVPVDRVVYKEVRHQEWHKHNSGCNVELI